MKTPGQEEAALRPRAADLPSLPATRSQSVPRDGSSSTVETVVSPGWAEKGLLVPVVLVELHPLAGATAVTAVTALRAEAEETADPRTGSWATAAGAAGAGPTTEPQEQAAAMVLQTALPVVLAHARLRLTVAPAVEEAVLRGAQAATVVVPGKAVRPVGAGGNTALAEEAAKGAGLNGGAGGPGGAPGVKGGGGGGGGSSDYCNGTGTGQGGHGHWGWCGTAGIYASGGDFFPVGYTGGFGDGAPGAGGAVLLDSAIGTIVNNGLIDASGGMYPRSGNVAPDGPVAIHGTITGTGSILGRWEIVPRGVGNADFILTGGEPGGGGGGDGYRQINSSSHRWTERSRQGERVTEPLQPGHRGELRAGATGHRDGGRL